MQTRAAVVSRILTVLLQVPNGCTRTDRPALLAYSSNVHRFTRRICIMHLARYHVLSRRFRFRAPTPGSPRDTRIRESNGCEDKREWEDGDEGPREKKHKKRDCVRV